MDPNYKLKYEDEKQLQCASVSFSIEKMLKSININGEVHVPTYGDLVKRHLREDATIIKIRDTACNEINKGFLKTHLEMGEGGEINCETICADARAMINQTILAEISKNSHKFKTQEPSPEHKDSIQNSILDEAFRFVAKNLHTKL